MVPRAQIPPERPIEEADEEERRHQDDEEKADHQLRPKASEHGCLSLQSNATT